MSTSTGLKQRHVEFVELRVHGVHGTSPAAMLGVEQGDVRQVAGDNLTGFYRSKSGVLPYRDLTTAPEVSVEAYSWGSLTSGIRGFLGWLQRAMWLLLLPFALANLAYWARLQMQGSSPAARWGARFTRLGALLLTMFMVLVPALIGIDLVAWQCYRGDSPGCAALPGSFDFMADLTAGQRLAVGSLLPLAFVFVLWYLSRQSMLRYEEISYDEGLTFAEDSTVLRHPTLWNDKDRTQQLQRAHLTVALAVVVGFSGVHVVDQVGFAGGWLWGSLALTAVISVTTFLWTLTIHPDDVEHRGLPTTRAITVWRALFRGDGVETWVRENSPGALLVGMCGTTLVHLAVLSTLPADLEQDVDFFGHNFWFIAVFVALTAVHMALFTCERMKWWPLSVLVVAALAAGAVFGHLNRLPQEKWTALGLVAAVAVLYGVLFRWQYRNREERQGKAWNGAGASVFFAGAGWVALLFTTGAVTATANYLNGGDHGVDDLVSKLADDNKRAVASTVEGLGGYGKPGLEAKYDVTGNVVVRNAVITIEGREPSIRFGTVEAERIYQVDAKSLRELDGVALQRGRVRLTSGHIGLETDSIRLEDSCVRISNTGACTPEAERFLVGGWLDLPAPRLKVVGDLDGDGEADEDGVELVTTAPPAVPLVVPQVLIWAPLAQTLWLVLTAVWVTAAWAVFRSRCDHAIKEQVEHDGIAVQDRGECRKARSRAAFAHRAERLLDVVGAITAALVLGLIIASATGKPPWAWAEFGWLRPLATVGLYVALGLGLATVLLLSRVRTSDSTRKAVGVLWDLTTFWPRAAHPLAPPCYAERVVPELRTRIDWVLHLRNTDGPDPREENILVLSAHSQGAVIACAVLSRMSPQDLSRTRVITYGSQVRALYGRVFPAVFGADQIGYVTTRHPAVLSDPFPDTPALVPPPPSERAYQVPAQDPESLVAEQPLLSRVFQSGGQWVNLFRRSDPLGFRLFSDHDAEPDRYVPEVPDVVVGDAGPRVNTHSGYQHTYVYRETVAGWTGETAVADHLSTANLPSVPY